jgi:alpha-1,2-glucosyltransferase
MSSVLAWAFRRLTPFDFCRIDHLRAINVAFCLGIYFIGYRLSFLLHPNLNRRDRRWTALAMTTFPPLAFFHFLYYTDSGSTFFILLAFYLAKRRSYPLSALVQLVMIDI